ncbi:MAG: T9SS type A sorting domain-containing protein [Flavobacteriales bacterium]|nr:T9SS type A sorting domain-containing protein [Flavobacteriales bacterium]
MLVFMSQAQTTVHISQGPSYASDVYVSMQDGEVATIDATNWDLAFEVSSAFAIGIRINDGQGTLLKSYPNGDISDWDMVDTTGFSSWPQLNNEIDLWEDGAFNVSPAGGGSDFSWGYYTGDPLHDVVGDSIYVVSTVEGAFKKLRLDLLDGGEWTFTHANLDGSDEVQETFSIAEYTNKSFTYYSLDSQTFTDREPEGTEWDMVFTRYFGQTSFGPGATAGVLMNRGVEMIQADGVDVNTVLYTDYEWTSHQEDIGIIGNDWKSLNDMFMWEVVADRAYFVKNIAGDIYKAIFTSFEGSSTGNAEYTSELITGASVEELFASDLIAYPNPVSNGTLYIQTETTMDNVDIHIHNAQGLLVNHISVPLLTETTSIDVAALPSGMYYASIIEGSQRVTKTFVIQ